MKCTSRGSGGQRQDIGSLACLVVVRCGRRRRQGGPGAEAEAARRRGGSKERATPSWPMKRKARRTGVSCDVPAVVCGEGGGGAAGGGCNEHGRHYSSMSAHFCVRVCEARTALAILRMYPVQRANSCNECTMTRQIGIRGTGSGLLVHFTKGTL